MQQDDAATTHTASHIGQSEVGERANRLALLGRRTNLLALEIVLQNLALTHAGFEESAAAANETQNMARRVLDVAKDLHDAMQMA
jgi:hypothetical protein